MAKEFVYGTVWSAPPTIKITETSDGRFCKDEKDVSLYYQAVRNEYESNQLIITANRDIDAYALCVRDLCGENDRISAENIKVYVQKNILYNDCNGSGSMPDPLIPMEVAKKYRESILKEKQNGRLWVTIYVPKEIAPGKYSANFELIVEGNEGTETTEIPVTLEVLDYTLSDKMAPKTLFSWRYNRAAAGELDGSLAMMEHYYNFFQNYNISLEVLPMASLSGEELKRVIKKYGTRFSTFTIPSMLGEVSHDVANDENLFKEQILAIAEVSRPGENYFEKAMCYSKDEPDLDDASVLANLTDYFRVRNQYLEECIQMIEGDTTGKFEAVKMIRGWQDTVRNIPDIIPLITGSSTKWLVEHQDDEEVVKFLNVANCFCPMFSIVNQSYFGEFLLLCKKYDITLWWYGCSLPRPPYPTYHISDSNLLSARSVSWLQKKYNVAGNLYWDAAAYTDEAEVAYNQYINIYETPYRSSVAGWPAGDGFLVYPGAPYGIYGPLPSVRLMSIRDGMEEYKLLQAVEEAYQEHAKSFGDDFSVCEVMETLFYKDLYYEGVLMKQDGENGLLFATVRSKLLHILVNLAKGLGYKMDTISISGNGREGYIATYRCTAQKNAQLTFEKVMHVSQKGQTYTVKQRVAGDTYVNIKVSNGDEEAVYKQYIGFQSDIWND